MEVPVVVSRVLQSFFGRKVLKYALNLSKRKRPKVASFNFLHFSILLNNRTSAPSFKDALPIAGCVFAIKNFDKPTSLH